MKHHGWGSLFFRLFTSPLRVIGLERKVSERVKLQVDRRRARMWYAEHARPVTIVMPTYGPPDLTMEAVRRLRKNLKRVQARIVVVDDGSPPEEQRRLRSLDGAEVVLAAQNAGFAASVNRGIRAAPDRDDVVVLNNDVVAHGPWLEFLQRAAYYAEGAGIVGPKLLYPDGRVQSAGSYRNLGAPEWFDHRYRFRPADHGPAGVEAEVLAVTGACMYIRRDVLDLVGSFDESLPMAYEDVDYCLRAWEAGQLVHYEPRAVLTHLESPTRGTDVGERELASQRRFWEKWGRWFDERPVTTSEGALRVVYVTEDTGVGGGHRDVFEHLNRLQERGHAVALYSLGTRPDWFDLRVPVHTFHSYEQLAEALAEEDAIKVATWWATSPWVWRASVRRGLPLYFVQDIETSYYGDDGEMQSRVLASYREEFRYLTISRWNQARLSELGRAAELVPPGIDLDTFRPLPAKRRADLVLAIGRSLPLKNLPLTVAAWRRLDPQPELRMFGVEPEIGAKYAVPYVATPSDAEIAALMAESTVFVQTSRHEGFCLPLLEAMATGTPVVTTDAHGNRDFCRDGENCVMADPDPQSVASALERLLRDGSLRERLSAEGVATAREYAWDSRIDHLERFLRRVADEAAGGGRRDNPRPDAAIPAFPPGP